MALTLARTSRRHMTVALQGRRSKQIQSSPRQHVSMFISHRVATHEKCAARIKALLESRTERLDVYICETIWGGDKWLNWIKEHIAQSKILLVLAPRRDVHQIWIKRE